MNRQAGALSQKRSRAKVRIIELDATHWRDVMGYYNALKDALGSCEGHGSSIDAWIDSMLYGGMNRIEPPYLIRILGTSGCPADLQRHMGEMANAISKARHWKSQHYGIDVDVSFVVAP